MLQLKINRKSLMLNDWAAEGNQAPCNWIRKLKDEPSNCVGLMVSFIDVKSNKYSWIPMFHGPDLYKLYEIYYMFYPSQNPYFVYDMNGGKKIYYPSLNEPSIIFDGPNIEAAKNHLDKFIDRVNKLVAFI